MFIIMFLCFLLEDDVIQIFFKEYQKRLKSNN